MNPIPHANGPFRPAEPDNGHDASLDPAEGRAVEAEEQDSAQLVLSFASETDAMNNETGHDASAPSEETPAQISTAPTSRADEIVAAMAESEHVGVSEHVAVVDTVIASESERETIDLRSGTVVHEESFGARLRAAREARNWSREDVAGRLKLPTKLIAGIETDNYAGIAHPVYLRGYLTSYARLVGVPALLAEKTVGERAEEPPLIATGTVSRSRYLIDRYSVSATYLVLTALIVAPAVWLATHGGLEQNLARTAPLDAPAMIADANDGTQNSFAAEAQSAAADANNDQTPVVASMTPFASMPSSSTVDPTPAPASVTPAASSEGHTLKLRLSEASWVEVVAANGDKLEYAMLPAGAERTYRSDASLSVRLGNANGAAIEADGKALDVQAFRRANVAHLKVFGSEGAPVRVD